MLWHWHIGDIIKITINNHDRQKHVVTDKNAEKPCNCNVLAWHVYRYDPRYTEMAWKGGGGGGGENVGDLTRNRFYTCVWYCCIDVDEAVFIPCGGRLSLDVRWSFVAVCSLTVVRFVMMVFGPLLEMVWKTSATAVFIVGLMSPTDLVGHLGKTQGCL